MRIQEAIEVCSQEAESFARPVSWKGTGDAVDLARRMRKDRISKVHAIRDVAVWGSEWAIAPEDLLEDWEVVDLKTLAGELENKT